MRAIAQNLQRKLRKTDIVEKCGLVLKSGKIIPVLNTHPKPEEGFRIEVSEMIAHEDDLLGTWHTHPKTSSVLSHEDMEGFANWPHLVHFIVGTDGVRAYQFDDGFLMEIDLAG
jgi:proteasome lid subunit RPN8/RPN11